MSILKELLALNESSRGEAEPYQVRIENSDWMDALLYFKDLSAIASAIDDRGDSDTGQLTEIVEDYIGKGPNSRGDNRGSWDEMDFEVKSFKDDVLKIKYTFAGVDMGRLEGKYGTPVKKQGVITIMPGN